MSSHLYQVGDNTTQMSLYLYQVGDNTTQMSSHLYQVGDNTTQMSSHLNLGIRWAISQSNFWQSYSLQNS